MDHQQAERLINLVGQLTEYAGVIARHFDPTLPTEKVHTVDAWVLGETSNDEPCVYLYADHPGLQFRVSTVYVEKLDTLPFDWQKGVTQNTWPGAAPDRNTAAKKRSLNSVPPFQIVTQSSGKTTDEGQPIMRYAGCRGVAASSHRPAHNNGNGAGPKEPPVDPDWNKMPSAGEQLEAAQAAAAIDYRNNARPWTGPMVTQALRDAAASAATDPTKVATEGAFGAALACLAKVGERADFFQLVWNVVSAKKLSPSQRYAFTRWVKATKDQQTSEWIPGEYFHKEARAVLDLVMEGAA